MALSRLGGVWNYATFTPITITNTPTILSGWETEHDGPGCEANAPAGTIQIRVPGYYLGLLTLSFIGDAGVTYFAEFREDGAVGGGMRGCITAKGGGQADNLAVIAGGRVPENALISIFIYADVASASFTLVDGQFVLLSE